MKKAFFRFAAYVLLCSPLFFFLTGATNIGGGGGCSNVSSSPVPPPNTFTVGGTVSGLSGTVILLNNGGDADTITSNGAFTFPTPVAEGNPYNVTVQTQPAIQTCFVSNGSGTMGGSNITNVSVHCEESIAYVTPLSPDSATASQIQLYSLSQDALLSFSENATQTEGHYGQMAFATVSGTQYAYILESGVTYCSVNSEGTFSNCTPVTAGGLSSTHGIAFATFSDQQYAYLVDPSNSFLFQCSINTTNGDLSSCTGYVDGDVDAPFGIAFNTDGNGNQNAYIADASTGMVDCSMDSILGSFVNCNTTPSLGVPLWVPYSIAFTTAGGTRYAYVADNGPGTNLGHVYRCLLNADGTFKDNGCAATPTDTSSYAPWNPYYIAFKALNGTQYAYVVNNQGVNIGSIYRCTVDESTGLLNQDCIKTPDNPTGRDTWQPSGISFR